MLHTDSIRSTYMRREIYVEIIGHISLRHLKFNESK